MDREGVRGLRAQPGYPAFVGAATLARTSDEMFSVGVVLLVLERTGSPGLAGAAIAATTLPSILTAPLFGALLDVSGRWRGADGPEPGGDRRRAAGAGGDDRHSAASRA